MSRQRCPETLSGSNCQEKDFSGNKSRSGVSCPAEKAVPGIRLLPMERALCMNSRSKAGQAGSGDQRRSPLAVNSPVIVVSHTFGVNAMKKILAIAVVA